MQPLKAQIVKQYVIGFYNVENLFDTIDSPNTDDKDFLPTAESQWNAIKYDSKLDRLSEVIANIGGEKSLGLDKGPDLLGMCEVENKAVLEDLLKTNRLKKTTFGIVHHDSPDERGIDVAFVYRTSKMQVIGQKAFKVVRTDKPDDKTRDILLASFKVGSDTLHAFVCHFPSRRGGQEGSEPARMAAAMTARKAIDSLLQKNLRAKIILMGDLNDEPSDNSVRIGLKALGGVDSLGKGDLWDIMAPLQKEGQGSYMHNKKWNMLDHIIVSQGLLTDEAKMALHYVDGSATIYKPEYLQEQNERFKGAPYRTYAGKRYLGGYSDHFAVYAKLEQPIPLKEIVPKVKGFKKKSAK